MELRIPINNRRKQFTGISRDNLCDFQYGIQYQFPYPVRYGQLESIPRSFTEEGSDSFVSLKPLHRTKYIVLYHRQRSACNLSGEVEALAFSEAKQLFTIVICHLSSPAGSISPICLKEAEREVRGEQSVPLSFSASLRKEQTHSGSCKLHVYGAVGALQCPIVLGEALLLELFDNLVGCQVAPLGVVFGLAQLYHTNQMTLDVATGNEFHKVCTGKPAIHEQIVETDTSLDGILHHLDGLVYLRHRVLLDAFLDALSCVVGRETLAALLVRQPLLLIWITALLAMKREVEEKMAQTVGIEQRHALITEDGLVQDMGEHLADELTPASAFRFVRVIDYQADWSFMRGLCASTDLAQKLEIHSIQQLAPFDIAVIHKTIEHVLLTTEQAT